MEDSEDLNLSDYNGQLIFAEDGTFSAIFANQLREFINEDIVLAITNQYSTILVLGDGRVYSIADELTIFHIDFDFLNVINTNDSLHFLILASDGVLHMFRQIWTSPNQDKFPIIAENVKQIFPLNSVSIDTSFFNLLTLDFSNTFSFINTDPKFLRGLPGNPLYSIRGQYSIQQLSNLRKIISFDWFYLALTQGGEVFIIRFESDDSNDEMAEYYDNPFSDFTLSQEEIEGLDYDTIEPIDQQTWLRPRKILIAESEKLRGLIDIEIEVNDDQFTYYYLYDDGSLWQRRPSHPTFPLRLPAIRQLSFHSDGYGINRYLLTVDNQLLRLTRDGYEVIQTPPERGRLSFLTYRQEQIFSNFIRVKRSYRY